MIKIDLNNDYTKSYTQGYDARKEELFVNPFLNNYEDLDLYRGWQDGWKDADSDLELAK